MFYVQMTSPGTACAEDATQIQCVQSLTEPRVQSVTQHFLSAELCARYRVLKYGPRIDENFIKEISSPRPNTNR